LRERLIELTDFLKQAYRKAVGT